MSLANGTRIGPYEITDRIGAGGMGEVFRARDTRLERTVAIKILPSHFESNPNLKERFEREARAISSLNHPHICVLYDVGETTISDNVEPGTRNAERIPYLVMEYLEGEPLADRLKRGPIPLDEVLRLGTQIASALAAAHRQGIIHRDLKPGNVMLTRSGAKLLDFGLAKAPHADASFDGVTEQKALTREGSILGTFQYMAPEQLEGKEADARADIWALGCVLHEMATGRRPFEGNSQASLIGSILRDDPPPVSYLQPSAPTAIDHVVARCLAKDRENRWQAAQDVAAELQWIAAAPSGVRPVAPPPRNLYSRRAIAGVLVVLALSFVVWKWTSARAGRNAVPVIVLMDSTHPERVYDDETRRRGGTNADDLSDLLNDLGVVLLKENTSWTWHREDEVLRQNPDLIVLHRSCFYVPSGMGNEAFEKDFYARASDKMEMFLGYIALGNPRTKFLVYSRRSWANEQERDRWVASLESRYPSLKGRITAWSVPLDRPTFRHPETAAEIKRAVKQKLEIER